MNVAVTGASGFIGVHACRTLTSKGYDVAEINRTDAAANGVRQGVGCILHLAGIAHRHASAQELEEVNVKGTVRLARVAAELGARFIFVSSVKVHGETSDAPLTERSAIKPADPYAASKARAEEALAHIRGLSLTVLRPPLVYGPEVKANFLALVRAIDRGWPLPLRGVANRRSLLYVANLVDAIIRCLHQEGTFLVCDGPPVSTPQLCLEIGEVLGRPARLFPFPASLLPRKLAGSLEVDDSAIRRTIGWQPPYTRVQGLKATADWYRAR